MTSCYAFASSATLIAVTRKAAPKKKARARGPGRPSRGPSAEHSHSYPVTARVIKRYGNRRLYDPELSRCVTMGEIADLVREGKDVRVVDGDSGEDLTKRVLVQIILETQNASQLELLPVPLLHQIISVRSAPVAGWLGQYLQAGAEFMERQSQAAGPNLRNMTESMGALFPWLNSDTWKGAAPPTQAAPPRSDSKEPDPALRRELDELERRFAELHARFGRS